jgi:phospholipid/cholesterol/gamma-HCH transport system permease protein
MKRFGVQMFLTGIGAAFMFSLDALRALLRAGIRPAQIVDQVYRVGVKSFPTTFLAGGFVGAILAVQINLQLRDFGAQGFLGGLSTSTTIRDLGPVLIAFILSGKVGAFTSAELATMKVTEQMDAIRCLGADPLEYLIVPRMVAVVISSFLLLIVGLMMTVGGGMLLSDLTLGVNTIAYLSNIARVVTWWSVGMGIFKSFVFGNLIAVISCYQGYHAEGGARGVGDAVRRTSVQTLLSIIIVNFAISGLATSLLEWLGWDRI